MLQNRHYQLDNNNPFPKKSKSLNHKFIPPTKKMKPSQAIIRDKIFKDHHFYQPRQAPTPVSTEQYQRQQHQKVTHEYQSKKVPQFAQYKHASSWNPLNRKYERVDKPYKELYERKQRVGKYSDMRSDPFSVKPIKQAPTATITSPKRHYQPSQIYIAEHERRYLLPKDREVSRANKHYHSQVGISQQRLPVPNRKQKEMNMRNSSSLMRISMDHGLGRSQGLNRSMEGFAHD